jgi:hypothetical protein
MSESGETHRVAARDCAVHRQDDNGNRFVVQRSLTRDEAEQMVAMYEERGHKQTYWVEADQK